MRYDRVYNFSAGPAMMPESVLEEIAAEVLNYHGSGMSVMEMSHRSPVFQDILAEAEADLRTLMHIPDNYKVLFVQGGGTVQFAMVPMNLMKNGVACYVETGAWSKKAIAEAKRYGEVKIVASSADKNFSYIPDCSDLDIPDNADYVYICENETINGTTYHTAARHQGQDSGGGPVLHVPLPSLRCQQVRPDLGRRPEERGTRRYGDGHHPGGPDCGRICRSSSPPISATRPTRTPTPCTTLPTAGPSTAAARCSSTCWPTADWRPWHKRNEEKAAVLYDFLDRSKFFTGAVRKEDRSLMNVPFVTPSKEQDADVVAASKAAGFDNLKGHKSVGGLRASIYNAMPKEGVEALVDFLKKYEAEHT